MSRRTVTNAIAVAFFSFPGPYLLYRDRLFGGHGRQITATGLVVLLQRYSPLVGKAEK